MLGLGLQVFGVKGLEFSGSPRGHRRAFCLRSRLDTRLENILQFTQKLAGKGDLTKCNSAVESNSSPAKRTNPNTSVPIIIYSET